MQAPLLPERGWPRERRNGCWALVAVKRRVEGKGRLAGVLPVTERVALVRAMLRRVLEALEATPHIQQVVVVSPERDEVPAHIPVLADRNAGLNVALAEAREALLGFGAGALLVLPADLPQISPAAIERLVRAGRYGFAIAPDTGGTGSNGLYLRGRSDFQFQFGAQSLRRHLAEARRHGLVPRVHIDAELGIDVDAPADLSALDPTRWPLTRSA